jgi:hypothetical protein
VSPAAPANSTRTVSDTLPPPAFLLAEIRSGRRLAYPAGKGNAAILPSMALKSRRVRWLSASSSQ